MTDYRWPAVNPRVSVEAWPEGARRLSANFRLHEWAKSASFPEFVEPVPIELVPRAERTTVTVIQPIRDDIGRPMKTLSGYRSETLNRAVGGSKSSQHRTASALDWTCEQLRDAWLKILDMVADNRLPGAGQLIYYPDQGFIHAALASGRYPRPTCCIHWPSAGITSYRVISPTPAAFAQAVPRTRDPSRHV